MVIYSVVTTYHLLEAMVFHLNYNKGKESVLLLSHWMKAKYPWYQDLGNIFNKVIIYNANYSCDVDAEVYLFDYFETLFLENGVDIETNEEVHVWGAEHSFGAYVAVNNFEYVYWEEGAGALAKTKEMHESFTKVHGEKKAEFQWNNHLHDGDTPYVIKRYYNRYFQQQEVQGNNLIHFDVCEELDDMDRDNRECIIGLFYGDDKMVVEENTALILTEHLANLSIMTWEEQEYSYKYLVDYFVGNKKLLFKPHPDDLMYYEYIFASSKVIRTKFPAELLPYIFQRRPEMIATSSSTSIYGLRKLFDYVLEFNFEFSHRKMFYWLNRYYVALSIADKYIKSGHKLKMVGINQSFIDNFCKFCDLGTRDYEMVGLEDLEGVEDSKEIWLIDEVEHPQSNAKAICEFLMGLSEDTPVIFMNSDQEYCFYHTDYKGLWKNMNQVKVYTKKLSCSEEQRLFCGPSVQDERSEYIYIYYKGGDFMMYQVDKELPNVGVSVHSDNFDKDKLQIKILEGILKASEKRLLYYINREAELLKELEEKRS